MAVTDKKLEAKLVSMAGTLIHLDKVESLLINKPMIPLPVTEHMSDTKRQLDTLMAQCQLTRQAALADARPLLDTWLAQMGLPVGGVLSISTRRAKLGAVLHVTGGIAAARLHHALVAGARVVDFTLTGATIRLPDGDILNQVADIPVSEQSGYQLTALKDITTKNLQTGTTDVALHVRIAIQAAQRLRQFRAGTLILL